VALLLLLSENFQAFYKAFSKSFMSLNREMNSIRTHFNIPLAGIDGRDVILLRYLRLMNITSNINLICLEKRSLFGLWNLFEITGSIASLENSCTLA